MQSILLAAGQSSRLAPLSDKNLLPFCGKPLIWHQVEMLKKAGVEKVVVAGNVDNLSEFREIFQGDGQVEFAQQTNQSEGQAGGVRAGASKISGNQVLIVSSNDVFEPRLLAEVVELAKKSEFQGVIAGKEVDRYFPGGYLKLNEQGEITQIIEKPGEGNQPSNLVNLICHFYSDFPAFLEHLDKTESPKDDVYEVTLDQYIKNGARLLAHRYNGFWQPIKYPWHVLRVMSYFLESQTERIDPSAQISETAIIRGNVVVEAGVKVFDHAVIQGPAYIGKDSVVANNALVRSSMVGESCVVGFGTEIARSYLKGYVWTHSNYVGDSVIDENVSFGAGAVTGNLRHDEGEIKMAIKGERIGSGQTKLGAIIGSGTRIGIQAATNPGVKIGQNCFIGGGVLVQRDVEDGRKVVLRQELAMGENERRVSTEDRREVA